MTPSLKRRIFAAFLATFAVLGFFSSLLELTGLSWNAYQYASITTFVLVALLLSVLVIFVVITWSKAFSVMDALINYWLAFGISLYGFAKIFKTQFGLPEHNTDMRVSDLSGIELTWHYFGYSYTFAVMIGILQIVGALMLVINRTRIAGALILLPLMINILLINIFFDIAPGALVNSVIFTVSLCYIMAPRVRPLAGALFARNGSSIKWQRQLIIAAAIAMVAGWSLYRLRPLESTFKGKFEVEDIKMPNDSMPTGIMNWKRIYVEEWGVIIFSANALVYSPDDAINGGYRIDEKSSSLKVLFEPGYSEPDTVTINAKRLGGARQEWTFPFQKNKITLRLKKIK